MPPPSRAALDERDPTLKFFPQQVQYNEHTGRTDNRQCVSTDASEVLTSVKERFLRTALVDVAHGSRPC